MDNKALETLEKILREVQDIKVILQENLNEDKSEEYKGCSK